MYCIELVNLDPARLSKVNWILNSGLINENVWLAGGALRTLIDPTEKICDYDLFFKQRENNPFEPFDLTIDRNDGEVLKTKEKLEKLGFKLTFECPQGKLYSYEKEILPTTTELPESFNSPRKIKIQKVQLICEKFYDNPIQLLYEFDLTPTLFCTDVTYLWTDRRGVSAVKKKSCNLVALTHPVSTIKRLIKYEKKGYYVNSAIREIVSNLAGRSNILNLSEDELRVYID